LTTYPIVYTRPGHGNLTANSPTEAQQWEAMGFAAIPNEPATYNAYPLALYGPPDTDLPSLIVKNETEARAAAGRGYVLPSDEDLADGEEGFDAQYATVDEEHAPNEYPKYLYHPDHRLAIPQRFSWSTEANGLPKVAGLVAAVPEMYPPVVVANLQDEGYWRLKGWTIGAARVGKKSGAARRRLARQQLAEEERLMAGKRKASPSKKVVVAKKVASKAPTKAASRSTRKSPSSAEQNALRGLVKNPPVRDANPGAAYSTSARGRDSDPSRKRVKPRRG
jgi:hypothetical protein